METADEGLEAYEAESSSPLRLMVWVRQYAWFLLLGGSLFALVLLLHGLVPGLRQPTVQSHLGQGAVDCLRREGLGALDLRCDRVGLPVGQPFLSGLPQTYAAVLVSYLPGVAGGAARTVIDVLIDAASFLACFAIARRLGAAKVPAVFSGFVYLASLSIIYINGFAATFNGFVLLPVHVLLTIWILDMVDANERWWRWTLLAAVNALAMVFTDGYAFMIGVFLMAALVASWSLATSLPVAARLRAVGSLLAVTAVSVMAYRWYVPGSSYSANLPIDVFRSMGADAATFVVPQQTTWWAAITGVAVDFSGGWGDQSAYRSNYLGVFAVTVAGVVMLRRREDWILRAFGVAAAVSLFLALGPSLKLWSVTSLANGPVGERYYMPADEARFGLPTSWIYEFLPGFSDMRATYRWVIVAVAVVAFASSVGVTLLWRNGRRSLAILVGLLVLIDLAPNVPKILEFNRAGHVQYEAFVDGPGGEFPNLVGPGERLLFLPAGNDFLANALVGRTDALSYNVGIDKNAAYSQANWPSDVAAAAAAHGSESSREAAAVVLSQSVDAIVIPYFNLRDNAQTWPVTEETRLSLRGAADSFRQDVRFEVFDGNWFSLIRLRSEAGDGG